MVRVKFRSCEGKNKSLKSDKKTFAPKLKAPMDNFFV